MLRYLFHSLSLKHCRYFCSTVSILTVKEILITKPINQIVVVRGWVQSIRKHKDIYFVDLIDGTCHDRLQVLINTQTNSKWPAYGSSIKVEGSVAKSSHKGQELELVANSWLTFGTCGEDYPFYYHHKFPPEYVRQYFHLRSRTRKFSSVLRIRNHASIAIHSFFQKEGFCFVHTPIITKNDCEGAGEVFSIEMKNRDKTPTTEEKVSFDSSTVVRDNSGKNKLRINDQCLPNENEEFFGSPTYLTVSGQLHLEAIGC